MSYPLAVVVILAAIALMMYAGMWQESADECDGTLARGYWNQPVCVPVDRDGTNQ